ncbi:hypothetical protein NCHU2750_30360 [Neorhizobium sp. NCHU2750]|nr:hypothetical protein NCHU2750_30360 [Neorhizobium sp. NCHU2750]
MSAKATQREAELCSRRHTGPREPGLVIEATPLLGKSRAGRLNQAELIERAKSGGPNQAGMTNM